MFLRIPLSTIVLVLLFLGTGAAARPQLSEEEPEPGPLAQERLDEALDQAKSQEKRVFLQVGGPNCVWCDMLDHLLTREDVAEIMDRNYVIAKIDMGRMEDASEVVERFEPRGVPGIPWYAILDADGKAIVSSDGPNGNIGYPILDEGIEHFLSMVEQTARKLDEGGIDRLKHALEAEAGKIQDEIGYTPRSKVQPTEPKVDAEGLPDLAGTWSSISMTFRGKVQTTDSGPAVQWLKINGDQVAFDFGADIDFEDDMQFEWIITHLDPTAFPPQINLTRLRDDQTILGIYELDEGRLTMCTSHRGTRPTAFEATEEDGNLLRVYRKVDSD